MRCTLQAVLCMLVPWWSLWHALFTFSKCNSGSVVNLSVGVAACSCGIWCRDMQAVDHVQFHRILPGCAGVSQRGAVSESDSTVSDSCSAGHGWLYVAEDGWQDRWADSLVLYRLLPIGCLRCLTLRAPHLNLHSGCSITNDKGKHFVTLHLKVAGIELIVVIGTMIFGVFEMGFLDCSQSLRVQNCRMHSNAWRVSKRNLVVRPNFLPK